MTDEHDCQNVVTSVSDVSCYIVQLHYFVFFFGGGHDIEGGRLGKGRKEGRKDRG